MCQYKLREREGFPILKEEFTVPSDTACMDPAMKRKITICDLFTNQRQSVRAIAETLQEDYKNIVAILIGEKIILERRINSRILYHPERRHSLLNNYIASLEREVPLELQV